MKTSQEMLNQAKRLLCFNRYLDPRKATWFKKATHPRIMIYLTITGRKPRFAHYRHEIPKGDSNTISFNRYQSLVAYDTEAFKEAGL